MLNKAADLIADTSVAILAGGLGTRLRTVVADRPKVLAEVNGRPFLGLLLEFLEAFGVKNVVLCTGYKAEEVERTFGKAFGGLSITYSKELTPMGTGGALRQALPYLVSNRVLVLNGDSFCDADLIAMEEAHLSRNARATLALTWVDDTRRFGCVRLKSNDQIAVFSEKENAFGPGWINAGIYLLERDLIEVLPPNNFLSLEREVFPTWIHQDLFGFRTNGRFFDIGTPESYALANQDSLIEHASDRVSASRN